MTPNEKKEQQTPPAQASTPTAEPPMKNASPAPAAPAPTAGEKTEEQLAAEKWVENGRYLDEGSW